ncbi:hypothetical protein EZV62_006192 [Acer yangbiense]|uniref:TF-B3 domain-containing protein n=1 Tax=Acer yangbiense TaxID=1000413 RepID=A0A5C7IPE7_9ROSI|nr:hypothetical protein EZV62_006192 [Acer yangbiense]
MKENSFLSPDVNLQELDDLTKPVDQESIKVTTDDFFNALGEIIPALGASTDDLQHCSFPHSISLAYSYQPLYLITTSQPFVFLLLHFLIFGYPTLVISSWNTNGIVIFSQNLKPTDISARLAIPIDALEHINMPEGDNNVYPKDSDGKDWRFRCYTRPTGHPKPAFTTGWPGFVRAKGIQIGDKVVTFSKLKDEAGGEPQYRIHATRAIRLRGTQIVVPIK